MRILNASRVLPPKQSANTAESGDALAPARGILLAVLGGLAAWAGIILAVVQVLRRI